MDLQIKQITHSKLFTRPRAAPVLPHNARSYQKTNMWVYLHTSNTNQLPRVTVCSSSAGKNNFHVTQNLLLRTNWKSHKLKKPQTSPLLLKRAEVSVWSQPNWKNKLAAVARATKPPIRHKWTPSHFNSTPTTAASVQHARAVLNKTSKTDAKAFLITATETTSFSQPPPSPLLLHP